jgi:hypothetical protein
MKLAKRRLVFAIIIATAAVFCVWWIVDRSKPRPELFPNYRSTAEGAVSFTLTNPTTISYHYWILNELKTNRIWNIYPPVQVMHWEGRKELLPHQAATISVSPPNHAGKWRVTARCVRSPSAPPTLTTRVMDFLNDWNLGWVAAQLEIYDKGILVSGPEMPSEM